MKCLSPTYAESVGLAVKGRKLALVFSLCIFLMLFAGTALAQEATIVGSVTDPSGAAVPSATVTITNTGTGVVRTFATGADGSFVAPSLGLGSTTVRVEAKGFKAWEQKGLSLNVGDRARVDAKLELGTQQENITVEAAAVAVQTDTGTVSSLITPQQVSQLASNGRSIYNLVTLTPGASSLQGSYQAPTPVGGDANVSFNGNRQGHNIYLMDGGENLDRGGSGTMSVMPSQESIGEFRILTSNYDAEYGLSSAATITTVMKSGTKMYHVSAWEYLRNDALDARYYFSRSPSPVRELRSNIFGFNGGGPVDFWKKDADHKTFFFYNQEWRKLVQGGSLNTTVPNPDTYGGNLGSTAINVPAASAVAGSVLFANCPGGVAPAGIVQGSPFPGNTIPSCMLDQNAQALLNGKIFPAPTSGSQFVGGSNAPTNVTEEAVRVDHNFSDKFSIFGHFLAEQISQSFGTSMWSGDNVPSIGNTFGNPSYSAVVHATHTISPRVLNEIAFNYNGNRIHILPVAAFGSSLSAAGFTPNRVFNNSANINPVVDGKNPSIALGNTGTNYDINWMPWNNKADDYQIRDDVSWTRGAHQFRMGGSWAIYKKIQDVFGVPQGKFNFNGQFTGNDFADYLLGLANSYNEDAIHDNGYWNNVSWGAYFQDNWRASKRLTLNLGLRWDGVPHTYEAKHRSSNFYPSLYSQSALPTFATNPDLTTNYNFLDPSSAGLGGSPNKILQELGVQSYLNGIGIDGIGSTPKGLVDNHWAAFGPRIGFAYDVTGQGKTVIRGGFGVMYERIQGNDMYNGGNNAPFSGHVTFNNVSLSNPKQDLGSGSALAVPIPVTQIVGIDRKQYKLPTSTQFSIGVQQSLGAKSVLSVSYVGTQNRHQNYYIEEDLPTAANYAGLQGTKGTASNYNGLLQTLGFNSLRLAENGANAHYNSMQVDLRSTFTKDLQLQVGYTLSKAIDPATAAGSGSDLNSISNPFEGWKYDNGPSVFDHRQIFFVSFVYGLPIFRSTDNKFAKTLLGGWQISGIVTAQTGPPLNVNLGGDTGNNGVQNGTNRPSLSGSVSYPKTLNSSGIQWFSPSAFVDQTNSGCIAASSSSCVGPWGTLEHNGLTGPGRQNWNMSLHKAFVFSEARGSQLEFKADFFNLWNHTQWRADGNAGGIGNTIYGSNFGVITQAYDPRSLQLGLKLTF